ncbi:Pentatricopeptide repeat-containing protein At4g31850 [Durusdinium trenchii]|uniref:Chloroplastic (Protein PROTON GRADIENT REGULATION 3) n=1 Tax=Durusdinium trenchii TaxID=1381693 RepID=A0ABP0KT64_9DINO
MPKMKVQPDVISYSAAISACEKGGQWPQALKLFEAMPEVEVQPNLVAYNALFDCSEFQSSALGRALFLQSKLPEFQELRGCDASKIDLHDLSEGTARLVLCHWLSTAVATKLEQEKDLNCLIVTGRGRSRKEWDTTDVRQASLELLQDLGLQAGLLPKNPGRIRVRLRKADLPALRSAGASFNR